MFYIEKRLNEFSAAHRLMNYEGECKHLHGHNYAVTVTFSAPQLNSTGIAIDFDDIEIICNSWIKENLDHGVLINATDLDLLQFVKAHEQKHFILPGENTTAECIASYLYEIFSNKMGDYSYQSPPAKNIQLISVEVAESKNSRAIFSNR